LKPRGYHLQMKGLKAPLVAGAKVPVVLTFEKAGTRTIEMDVQAPGLVGEDALNDKS
jgi:copper(I)-binding protein